jgi:hypothetical protein
MFTRLAVSCQRAISVFDWAPDKNGRSKKPISMYFINIFLALKIEIIG